MKSFFKENLVLVAGVALPLLLTIIFFVATNIGKTTIALPKHELIFVAEEAYNSPYQIIVRNKRLHLTYTKPNKDNNYRKGNTPSLYVYDPITAESSEIELPAIGLQDGDTDVIIPALASKTVSSLKESPDGYQFSYVSRGGGNLMTEVFGGGYSSRSGQVLHKGPQRIDVPHADHYRASFVGWVIKNQGGADE